MVAGGIFALSMFSIWSPGMGSMMGGGGWGMMSGGYFTWAVGTMAAISLAAGGLTIVGGYAIYAKPASSSIWGIGILVASIVGLVTMSGFFIGPLLGIIGGILALTKK